ncbi:MAG: hypothetical protein E4H01_01710 [Lysobacterales bacterium]|nr:MAG: hypothetical protein E4H01_01710 [Xanthomonadales bacterium]
MKFLLVSAMVLSMVCLALALFHWVRLRRDLKNEPQEVVTQRPMWLEFPRTYTNRGRHHQRRFFVYFIVFVLLLIGYFALNGAVVPRT